MFGPSPHMMDNYHQNNYQWKIRSNAPQGRWTQCPQGRKIQNAPVHSCKNVASMSRNADHWCETCDRGFRTIQLLENHKQQHQKCNIDGCQFIAHPKVITKHIQMQHSTGLYKKIAKLDNPEEIKKWREERKRKYPTKDNIEKKEAEIKEKVDRGEKMGLKSNEQRRNQNNKTGLGAKRRHNFRNENQSKKCYRQHSSFTNSLKHSTRKEVIDKISSVLEDHSKLKPFTGIQGLIMDSDTEENTEQFNFAIVDDDYIPESSNKSENENPRLCGALSSLICNYGSSDDENEDENSSNYKVTSTINKTTSQGNIENHRSGESINVRINEDIKSDNESGPEESKIVKEIDNNNSTKEEPYSKKKKYISIEDKKTRSNKPRVIMKSKPKLPSTLLEKLLHREMQHERNVILQCVRYVVKNNFFDK